MISYQGIEAETYDLWFSQTPSEDYFFYQELIKDNPGKALEIGCGTGRLLIPYLEQGLQIEGVDASKDMLTICEEKSSNKGLAPTLYHQLMQELNIPSSYQTIYVPVDSFMLVNSRKDALETLNRFYNHLNPGGQLLVSLSLLQKSQQTPTWSLRRKGTRSNGSTIIVSEASEYDRAHQLQTCYFRYELYNPIGILTTTELTNYTLRWYSRYEFELMLEKTGFSEILVYGDYTNNPFNKNHNTMIFQAKK